jgi:hypothetical protein
MVLSKGAASLRFVHDFLKFRGLSSGRDSRFPMLWKDRKPCLGDDTPGTRFDRHYIYHPAWAARILARTRPDLHVDISSTLYFAAIVSSFVPVRFYDYRPADISLENLTSEAADLTALPFGDRTVRSLSCMHVVEHVGLGRYGDPLDPSGDLKAVSELTRVTTVGGSLLFVVPVGRPRILFNAHRIYSYDQVLELFPAFELQEFALVPDDPAHGGLVMKVGRETVDAQNYGCGCFWFLRCRD